MPRLIPFALWTLVLLVGAAVIYNQYQQSSPSSITGDEQGGVAQPVDSEDGRKFVSTPWKHFPNVDRFVLTDQTGQPFDSQTLAGRPYVVSFFFASCPSFCRDLNNELARLQKPLKNVDIQFLTVTVDPDVDTVKVLGKYAEGYNAQPQRWAFLRGPMADLKRVGEKMFNVVVDRDTHTDNILLVDKWGRYRDRFKWNQPQDMKRFLKVARQLAEETEPPLNESFETRNVFAGVEPANWGSLPWLRDFHVHDSDGNSFFSRDKTGQVWLAHLSQNGQESRTVSNSWLKDLQQKTSNDVELISLAATPDESGTASWKCFSASVRKFARIARECFGISLLEIMDDGSVNIDSDKLKSLENTVFLIDRWHNVRAQFDLADPDAKESLVNEINKVARESQPPRPTFGFSIDEEPTTDSK